MALNSLYPDGWFALGAAALKVIYMTCIISTVYFDSFCAITIVNMKIFHRFLSLFSYGMMEVLFLLS